MAGVETLRIPRRHTTTDVSDPNSRAWGRASSLAPDAFSRGIPRGTLRASLSQLRLGAHGRTGHGVLSHRRQGDRLREPVLEPDALIIQDATLLHQVDLFSGLPARGHILLNSTKSFDELGLGGFARASSNIGCARSPATELALKHVGRAVPNAALLGGFAAITGVIALKSVAAIREKFPRLSPRRMSPLRRRL